jgi:hypothetical protein
VSHFPRPLLSEYGVENALKALPQPIDSPRSRLFYRYCPTRLGCCSRLERPISWLPHNRSARSLTRSERFDRRSIALSRSSFSHRSPLPSTWIYFGQSVPTERRNVASFRSPTYSAAVSALINRGHAEACFRANGCIAVTTPEILTRSMEWRRRWSSSPPR